MKEEALFLWHSLGLVDLNKPNEPRRQESRSVSFVSRVAPFVNNLIARILMAIVLGLFVGLVVADSLEDMLIPVISKSVAQHLADDIKASKPELGRMLDVCRQYGLSFCYATKDKDLRPTPETEAFAGNFKILTPRNGPFKVGDKLFYHSMVSIPNNQTLHVGMAYGNYVRWSDALKDPILFLGSRGDELHFIVTLITVSCTTVLLCFFSVTRPAALMADLPFSEDKNRDKRLKEANFSAAYELQHMFKAFMAYSKSARNLQPRTGEFQRPIELRIDEALQTKRPRTQSFQNIRALGSEPSVYRTLETALAECTTIKEFRDELLNGLSHTDFKYCVLLQQGHDSAVAATSSVDHRALQLLSRIDHAAIIKLITETNKTMDIGAMSLRRYGFGMLAEYMQLKSVRYSPIKHHGNLIAALVVLVDNMMPELKPDALVDLESFCSRIGGSMANLLKRQELEAATLKDQLTGLPNRKFLQDYLSERLIISSKELFKSALSLLIVQPNISDAVIAKHGEAVRDKILQEVASQLQEGLTELVDKKVNWQVVRYDIEEFAICLQPFDETEALQLAAQLQAKMTKAKTSLGDLFGVSLTVGCATSPNDAKEERTLLSRAKLAMRFAEEFRPDLQIASAKEVPVSFEPSKRLADISGELGVLDCAALLQSIGNSQKTGVLSVEDELGRQFQSVFKAGRLLSSTLEEFKGIDAVVEFVTSFEAGRYNFRLVSDTELEKLAPGDNSSHPPLDKCLMEAALAEDHLKAAKRHLRESHLMRATPGDAAKQKWQKLETDTKSFNAAERQTMQRILALADGSRTLAHIFSEIDLAPTYLKWHAAAILTDNRLLQSKKVS